MNTCQESYAFSESTQSEGFSAIGVRLNFEKQ